MAELKRTRTQQPGGAAGGDQDLETDIEGEDDDLLLGPHNDRDHSSESEEEFDQDAAQEVYDDFIVGLRLHQRKMLAVVLMDNYQK